MSKKKNFIKILCIASIMTALYVGLDFLTEQVNVVFGGMLKISISGLPVIIVSLIGGPIWGAATGFIGEFLVQMLTYGFDATTLIYAAAAASRGLVMGLMFYAFKKSYNPFLLILESCISSLVVTVINSVGMIFSHMLYGYFSSYYSIYVALPMRIVAGVASAIVMAILLLPILKLLKKLQIKK